MTTGSAQELRSVRPGAVVVRLLGALAARGLAPASGVTPNSEPVTWVLGPGELAATAESVITQVRGERGDRVLMVGWIGVHPDAASAELLALWDLEERTRALGVPVLALRLGPLVGATSPLWHQLAATRPDAKLARKLVHPVLESDVVTTIDRAVTGRIPWDGWFELGGREVFAMSELAELARAARRGSPPASSGGWEPGRDALLEQRLIEPDVWVRWAGIEPGSVRAEAAKGPA